MLSSKAEAERDAEITQVNGKLYAIARPKDGKFGWFTKRHGLWHIGGVRRDGALS